LFVVFWFVFGAWGWAVGFGGAFPCRVVIFGGDYDEESTVSGAHGKRGAHQETVQ
jgi:hypothetical protein